MPESKDSQKHVDGVFYEYLPQTYAPPVSNFLVQIEKTSARLPRKLMTYITIAAALLIVQLAVFYLLLRSAGTL